MDKSIAFLLEADEKFLKIADMYGMPAFVSREPGFVSLCKTILEQQVSLNSAKAAFDKVNGLLNDFTPQNILLASEEDLKSCGVSRQKTKYIKGVAQAITDGRLDFESHLVKEHDEVRAELLALKGIGNWTSDIYLMFSLQSPDILPLGDIAILSAIKDVWGITGLDEIIIYTERWKPHRTAASFFLWHYYLEKRGRKFPH